MFSYMLFINIAGRFSKKETGCSESFEPKALIGNCKLWEKSLLWFQSIHNFPWHSLAGSFGLCNRS